MTGIDFLVELLNENEKKKYLKNPRKGFQKGKKKKKKNKTPQKTNPEPILKLLFTQTNQCLLPSNHSMHGKKEKEKKTKKWKSWKKFK